MCRFIAAVTRLSMLTKNIWSIRSLLGNLNTNQRNRGEDSVHSEAFQNLVRIHIKIRRIPELSSDINKGSEILLGVLGN